MSKLTSHAGGVTLLHERPNPKDSSSKNPGQAIQLNLVESVTKDILRSLRNNEQVRLKLGTKPAIYVGKKSHLLHHGTDAYPSEVFSGPADGSEPMHFSGKLCHTLEVQEANKATAGADDALANLQNTLKSMQEHKASSEASFVRNKDDIRQFAKRDNRPSPLTGKDRFLGGSTPSSPFLSAGYSPRLGPTSAPMLGAGPSKDKIRLDAIRIPMVHLLAIGPVTPKAVAEKLNVTKEDCDKVLDKVARDAKAAPGKRELKEKSYRELDVWKFPYQSQNDRQAAIDHAVQAYDRMRIERTDPLWQLLLAKEDRHKGINLSKLNFDKPVPSKDSTPRPTGHNTEGSTESKTSIGDVSDTTKESKAKKLKAPAASSRQVGHTKKPSGEASSKAKVVRDAAKDKPKKGAAKQSSRPAKENGKFKSSERIEDSDEEAEAASVVVAKAAAGTLKRKEPSAQKPAQPPRPTSITATKGPAHKPKLSNSSGGTNETEASNPARPAAAKSLQPRSRAESSTSRVSPRSRTDGSPQKPSPLGSSPPTNSTDADGSSTSKASSQSSAPSSPPSSTDMSDPKQGNKYSPIITEKRRTAMQNVSPPKRKAESSDDRPPAKRQQLNGTHLSTLPKGLADRLQRPTSERRPSGSESLSSPEKPQLSKQELVEDAKRFNKYYARYKDLHERLARIPAKDREDKDLDDLWKMHNRLQEMKSDIWDNWDKIEGKS